MGQLWTQEELECWFTCALYMSLTSCRSRRSSSVSSTFSPYICNSAWYRPSISCQIRINALRSVSYGVCWKTRHWATCSRWRRNANDKRGSNVTRSSHSCGQLEHRFSKRWLSLRDCSSLWTWLLTQGSLPAVPSADRSQRSGWRVLGPLIPSCAPAQWYRSTNRSELSVLDIDSGSAKNVDDEQGTRTWKSSTSKQLTCSCTISPSFCFSCDCRFSSSAVALVWRKLSYNDGLLPFEEATISVFSSISSCTRQQFGVHTGHFGCCFQKRQNDKHLVSRHLWNTCTWVKLVVIGDSLPAKLAVRDKARPGLGDLLSNSSSCHRISKINELAATRGQHYHHTMTGNKFWALFSVCWGIVWHTHTLTPSMERAKPTARRNAAVKQRRHYFAILWAQGSTARRNAAVKQRCHYFAILWAQGLRIRDVSLVADLFSELLVRQE